jgi:hypothetical protein
MMPSVFLGGLPKELAPPTQPTAGGVLIINFTQGDLVSQLLLNRPEELVGSVWLLQESLSVN